MDPYSIGSESGSEESTDEERFQRPSYSSDDEERRKSTKRKAPTKKASKSQRQNVHQGKQMSNQ